MKQIKFKQLATFGLCCSLLVNSLTGVTAIAETVTIESSPTAESTKENTEKSTKESTRETELQTNKTEEETSKVEVTKEETTSEKQEITETVDEGNSKATEEFNDFGSLLQPKQISPKAAKAVEQTATIPAVTYRFGFIDEKGAMVSPNFFVMQTNLTTVMNAMPNQVGTARGLNNGNLKYLTIPSQVLTYTAGTNPAFSGATDFRLTVPRYYKMPTVRPGAYYTGSSATYPIATTRVRFTTSAVPDERLEVTGGQYALAGTSTAHSYRMNHSPWSTDSTTTYFSGVLSRANTDVSTGQSQPNYYTTDDTMYYFLENRRITENFVDSAGVKITPPTGFTQGKQTVIESTQYTFTQSGTLPDTYQANGKTYKFKGWYKGETKPATLRTTKTPSYAMTYDDNDDLNVVYEVDTSKDYNFPSRAVSFQFLNEAGTIISPTPFTITTDLQQEINSTYTKLESITGTNSGNTKRVTIPAKTIRADVSLGGVNSYGTTNTRITIPKFYENISVYTGSAYTQATLNRYSTADNTLIGTPASNAPLYYGLNKMTATQFKVNEYDTTTTIPEQSKYLYNRLYVSGATNLFDSYYTPVGTIYYQLTNRKVTENFVDTNGVKITAPTGFTQGKKTSITNTDYTFTQSGTLPSTYKTSNGKVYKLKGWYKGNTKPATLNTGTPTYKVTYNNNDDLNVVYEETSKDYNFPSRAVSFQFLNEAGTIISPTPFTITTDLQQEINSTYTKLESITGTNSGNTKRVTIPAKTIRADVSLGGVNSYGTTNTRITIPKFYENISVYTGSAYTQATLNRYSTADNTLIGTPASNAPLYYGLNKMTATQFKMDEFDSTTTIPEQSKYLYNRLYVSGARDLFNSYVTPVGTIYYQLTNRKVTENFVDTNGVKITAPAGFTQGEKTSITNTDYTFTQSGTLPDTYTAGSKAYKLKGWYKGKTKPATLETSKTPSYKVTYDDNDDLNVVYEDLGETTTLPAQTFKFNFVDEQGNLVNPSGISLKGNLQEYVSGETPKIVGEIIGKDNGMVKEYTIPEKVFYGVTDTRYSFYGAKSTVFTIPKYYKALTKDPGTYYSKTAKVYPVASIRRKNFITGVLETETSSDLTYRDLFRLTEPNQFLLAETQYNVSPIKRTFTALGMAYRSPVAGFVVISEDDSPIYYYLENRRVTENFVDATGAKITPPTGFTQGKKTVIDSDNFTYTSAKALPASYTADGKSYVLQGWYKGTEKPATLETSKTPSYSVTYNDQDDLTVVYKEGTISADLTMRGAVDVIDNGAPMEYWEVLLKNTGEVPLTSIKIKPTTDWASGISAPTELFILGTGQNTKARPITKEQWEAGFEIPLDNSLPVGGQLTINLIGTKVTGQPGQVLEAAVEVTGNFGNLKASDTVRIKDLDQEIKEPTGEGFISVPTFDFGQVGVASATKQHGLKKAADYYGNGTRNPYVRISKTQPNWSLTAQLSQPKSATDSLPTATRLLLGAAPVSSFSNYNQPTELKNAIGTTNAIHLTANNAATSIIANQQFTGSDVYQLDFTFDNIKLEVPANQGTAGQQYQAAVTWNLVTGP